MPKAELGIMIASMLKRAGHKHEDGRVNYYAAGKATGEDPSTIKRLCEGAVSPSIETLEKIAAAIGWEVAVLFQPKK